MINKIIIPDDFKYKNRLSFEEIPKLYCINILVGGNGAGKTTLLNALYNNELKIESDKEVKILKYTNSEDNYNHINLDMKYGDDIFKFKNLHHLKRKQDVHEMSEGQGILYSFLCFLEKVENIKSEDKDVIVILDEIDSGLSVENINMISHIVLEKSNKGIQFFISSNNYHFTHVFKNVINMYNGNTQKINSYEDYYNLISTPMTKVGIKSKLNFLKIIKGEI